jgi:hypothetical protein
VAVGVLLLGACSWGARGAARPPAPVTAAEAVDALDELRLIASARTPEAMEELCAHSRDDCFGLSGSITSFPASAPSLDVPMPTILCNLDVGDGARMLVVEGTDGYGQAYVSQVVLRRFDDGAVAPVREPAFWLGLSHATTDVIGATSWSVARHPQPGVTDEVRAEELFERARAACVSGP